MLKGKLKEHLLTIQEQAEQRMELLTAENRRHELELKVAEVEQRSKSNTHRLNRLEGVSPSWPALTGHL